MADVAKVFMSGRSQAVRLPKSYRIDCAEVEITRPGRRRDPAADGRRSHGRTSEAALAEFDAAVPFEFDREQPPPQERPELDKLFE